MALVLRKFILHAHRSTHQAPIVLHRPLANRPRTAAVTLLLVDARDAVCRVTQRFLSAHCRIVLLLGLLFDDGQGTTVVVVLGGFGIAVLLM